MSAWNLYGRELADDVNRLGVVCFCEVEHSYWWIHDRPLPYEIAMRLDGERRARLRAEKDERWRLYARANRLKREWDEALRLAQELARDTPEPTFAEIEQRRWREGARKRREAVRKRLAEERARGRAWGAATQALRELREEFGPVRDDALLEHRPPFPKRKRKRVERVELPDHGPTVFVEGLGWLNPRESLVWENDDLTLRDARQRRGSWCDTEWDARFDDQTLLQVAAIDDGTAISSVAGRYGREILPKRVPWVDEIDDHFSYRAAAKRDIVRTRGSDW